MQYSFECIYFNMNFLESEWVMNTGFGHVFSKYFKRDKILIYGMCNSCKWFFSRADQGKLQKAMHTSTDPNRQYVDPRKISRVRFPSFSYIQVGYRVGKEIVNWGGLIDWNRGSRDSHQTNAPLATNWFEAAKSKTEQM